MKALGQQTRIAAKCACSFKLCARRDPGFSERGSESGLDLEGWG